MDFTEKKLKRINSYDGIIVGVKVEQVELPNGGKTLRETVDHPGGVAILPVDGEGYAYCVRQYRYTFATHTIEAPAGKIEPGETTMECAVRELSEETGITAGKYIYLGEMYPSPGFCKEVLHAYLATDLQMGEAHPDSNEFLDVIRIHMNDLVSMVVSGEIKDAKTIIAVLKATYIWGNKDGTESLDS